MEIISSAGCRLERKTGLVAANVGFNHHLAQLFQRGGRRPTQLGLGALGVADQQFHFRRTVELGVDAHHGLAGRGVDSGFAFSLTLELDVNACALEGHLHEVAHGLGTVRGQHEGIGLVSLEHAPHAFHVFLGEAPVALGVEVAQFQAVQLAQLDLGDAIGDLARHELAAAQRAFVVEQNAAAAENAVAFTVVDGHPVRIQLGHAIGAARVEGCVFDLGNGLHLAEHLGCAGLVEANLWVDDADGFQQVHWAEAGDFCSGHGLLKRHAYETLCSQVIHLGGASCLKEPNAGRQVGQIIFH